jgi:hypothetical protein
VHENQLPQVKELIWIPSIVVRQAGGDLKNTVGIVACGGTGGIDFTEDVTSQVANYFKQYKTADFRMFLVRTYVNYGRVTALGQRRLAHKMHSGG